MARYTEDTTITIPPNAADITIFVAAGSGGSGGDDGNPGGAGGGGRWGTFTLPSFTPRTLTLRIGKRGGNGFGCVSNSGAGSGGASSVAPGGGGGRTGPQGCSGGGAGGGGASAIYDSLKNGYIIVAGGGGGGGGASYPDSFLRGGTGGFGLGFETGNLSTISGGGTGASQGFDGGGGGGGGGGCPGGGGGREGADDRAGRYPSGGGSGGASSYDSNYANFTGSGTNQFGDGYIDVNFTLVSPSIDSYSANPVEIIRGQSSTLSWTTSNAISASISGIGNVDVDGSVVVSPQSTTTYTLTATGYGNQTTTRNLTVTVYVPPVVTLSLARNPIIAGECTTLSWSTTGDADTIEWLSRNINNFNLTSSSTVCPVDTTIYSAKVSGKGGEDTDSITLVVNQIPTLSFTVPDIINYGDAASLQYESKYCDNSLNLKISYRYTNGTTSLVEDINLPNASSAQLNGANNSVSGVRDLNIQYGDFGPRYIDVVMTASGSGGQVTLSREIEVLIDETPDNIIVPETEDKFKSQDPVFAPETEVLSELLLVDDVDIPVEIKSNFPIQVDINGQGTWNNVRQIT